MSNSETDQQQLYSLIRKSRIKGEIKGEIKEYKVFWQFLKSSTAWSSTATIIQDHTIQLIASRLSSEFDFQYCKTFECEGLSNRIAIFKNRATDLLFNLLPGGAFDFVCVNCERPAAKRSVAIPPFLVSQTPVTQAAWDCASIQDFRPEQGPDLPITGVSCFACQTWLKSIPGNLRMITESEWEYACRAGSEADYFFGNDRRLLANTFFN